ncbi:MAG: thiol-disulfide oxidoreductase DCC family protein [Ignavibacteriaceae bacterium]
MQHHNIILFDGVCNFCNFWVNFTIDGDKDNIFRFAALQSEAGQKLLQEYKLNVSDFDTFVLIVNDKHFTKSTATLKIARKLNYPVKVLYYFIFIPKFLRDLIYSLIAINRYKIFGRRDICRIPLEDERDKFLN